MRHTVMKEAIQRIVNTRLVFLCCLILIAGIFLVLLVVSSATPYKEERGDTSSSLGAQPKEPELTQQQNVGVDKETTKMPSKPPFDSAFFRETDIGKIILAYLRCIDFDCSEALQTVVRRGPEAVPPLIQLLHQGVPQDIARELPGDVPIMVRIRAIISLGSIHDIRAVGPLVVVLQDRNPLVRAEAAAALGQFSGADAVLVALLPLLEDRDPLVREKTVSALERLGRPEALPNIRAAAEAELDENIRNTIKKAIETLEMQ